MSPLPFGDNTVFNVTDLYDFWFSQLPSFYHNLWVRDSLCIYVHMVGSVELQLPVKVDLDSDIQPFWLFWHILTDSKLINNQRADSKNK